jgi:hypothetical protein
VSSAIATTTSARTTSKNVLWNCEFREWTVGELLNCILWKFYYT